MQPEQAPSSATGNRLENILTSEATLVPFPPGEYRIAIGGMEHPAKNVANTLFPAVLVTVLPGCRQTTKLDAGDGAVAWLQRAAEQTLLSVSGPGGLVLFTTYRPSDYASTGIRMDIERLKSQSPAPPPGMQPAGPAVAPQVPGFPQPPQAQPPFGSLTLTPPGGQGLGFAPQPPFGAPQQQPASFSGQPAFGAFAEAGRQPHQPQPQPPFAPQAPAFGAPSQAGFGQIPQPGFGQTLQPGFGQIPQPGFGQTPPPSFAPAAPRPFTPPMQPAAVTPPQAAAGVPGIRMAAHIENEGDVACEPGHGAGRQGSRQRVEAVALYTEGVNLHEIEYAAVSYDGRLMPWVCPPQFTGTRGMGAPLLGFAARLTGDAANRYDIVYTGSFFQAGPVGPVRNGDFLKSTAQGDALEQLTVFLEPKR